MTTDTALPPTREGRHQLPDGRTIGYGLYGAIDGPLVLVLDGPGSRGLAESAATADVLGVTLLVPDRPGWGESTPTPGRSIVDVSQDLLEVARSLGQRRFGIRLRPRTPYALAVAAAAGDDVTGLSFVGAISPLGERDALQDVRGRRCCCSSSRAVRRGCSRRC